MQGSSTSKSGNSSGEVFDEYHFVQPGETLYAISRKYAATVEQLKAWNRLETNQIEVGQRLRVRP
jgi:membrane-bound lytic murein transglycosylase D